MEPNLLSLGVLGTSRKENEHRRPIHPRHFDRIDPEVRAKITLDTGYGRRFGVHDEQLRGQVGGILPRDEVIASCDVILLPKPTLADVEQLRDGQILWGWPHFVQDPVLTQLAVDKRLTLIAWEAMNYWSTSGSFIVHVFHLNNEIAGYASVDASDDAHGIHRHVRT